MFDHAAASRAAMAARLSEAQRYMAHLEAEVAARAADASAAADHLAHVPPPSPPRAPDRCLWPVLSRISAHRHVHERWERACGADE